MGGDGAEGGVGSDAARNTIPNAASGAVSSPGHRFKGTGRQAPESSAFCSRRKRDTRFILPEAPSVRGSSLWGPSARVSPSSSSCPLCGVELTSWVGDLAAAWALMPALASVQEPGQSETALGSRGLGALQT